MANKPTQAELIDAAAAKIAAEWPPLTEDQKEELRRIFAPFRRVERPSRRRVRRAA